MKRIAIMQPYFLPYIGYFQLMNCVDIFVIYDNIEFTKKGWINRNRMLQNNREEYFTLPLKKDSDYLNVNERSIADSFDVEKNKILRKIEANYRKAPQFNIVFSVMEKIFAFNEKNLFHFIYNSISVLNDYLGIKTRIIKSSDLPEDIEYLRGQEKVLKICKTLNAQQYINAIGGIGLYSRDDFQSEGLQLNFMQSQSIVYKQFTNEFVPWLSILDVMMFNDKLKIQEYLKEYTLF